MRILLACLITTFFTPVFAQNRPEITINGASQVPVELPRVGASVSLISSDDIEERGHKTMPDVLRSLLGVHVSQAGGGGSLADTRIRGGESGHTLIIVDGVVMNEGGGTYDLSQFPVADIERVEVVRGPQSGIYGASAHSGAILITTKSGRKMKPQISASFEHGSNNTQIGSLSAQGSKDTIYGAVTISGQRSNGYNLSQTGSEKDGYSAMNFSTKLGIDLSPQANLEAIFRRSERRFKSDDLNTSAGSPFIQLVDTKSANYTAQTAARLQATFKALDNKLTNQSAISYNSKTSNSFVDDPMFGGYDFNERNERVAFSNKTAYRFNTGDTKHTLVGGLDVQRETYKYLGSIEWQEGKTRNRTGVFGEYLLDFASGTSFTGAMRQDYNSAFANIFTYRLTAAHNFSATQTRLHASYGKGATNPTFFQQYGFTPSFFNGNLNLRPEQSLGYDIGVEQKFYNGKAIIDITYFNTILSDAISSTYPAPTYIETPINSTQTLRRSGAEITASLLPTSWLSLTANYTYFTGVDSGYLLPVRRPNHSGSLSATANFLENKARATLTANYNGGMRDVAFDSFFMPNSVSLKQFTLINALVSYDLNKTTTLFLRGENLLNTKYQEVYSYVGAPMQVFAGVKVKLGE